MSGSRSVAPQVFVEMTGEPTALEQATKAVADGGVILLAGEPAGRVDLNMYADVHRRGLAWSASLCSSRKRPRRIRPNSPRRCRSQLGMPCPEGCGIGSTVKREPIP